MKIFRNLMCLSTSAFLLAACNGNSSGVQKGAAAIELGDGKLAVYFKADGYQEWVTVPDFEIKLNPLSVVPPEFTETENNWDARQDYANSVLNLHPGAQNYPIQSNDLYLNTPNSSYIRIENEGTEDLYIKSISITAHRVNFGAITLESQSYPIIIRPNEDITLATDSDCNVYPNSNSSDPKGKEAVTVSVQSNAKDSPEFNSDLIIHCGY